MRLSTIRTVYGTLKAERDRLEAAYKLAYSVLEDKAREAPKDQLLMDYEPYATAKENLRKVNADLSAVLAAIADLETHWWT